MPDVEGSSNTCSNLVYCYPVDGFRVHLSSPVDGTNDYVNAIGVDVSITPTFCTVLVFKGSISDKKIPRP